MHCRRLATALLIAAFVPAASIARPGVGPVGAAGSAPEAVGVRSGASNVSQATGRVESGIVQLTCDSGGSPGAVGTTGCTTFAGGDLVFEFPLGQPPTPAELAAAKQVLRIDHIQVYVPNSGLCTFVLGVADPGGGPLGIPGPRIRYDPTSEVAAGQLSARLHVPGIDMEFTTLGCQNPVRGADIQIYYTRVPRGR